MPDAEAAKKLAEEAEFGSRRFSGFCRWLIPLVAGSWSVFQLALPKLIILDSVHIRCIHLAFAIVLVYLSYPASKRRVRTGFFSFLSQKDNPPAVDWILALTGAMAALYLSADYLGISERQGAPLARDVAAGVVLIVLLLEAARRALGLALPCIVGLFIFTASSGPICLSSSHSRGYR